MAREGSLWNITPGERFSLIHVCKQMNKTEGVPFRAFVPLLVANLEDADPGVRETAKISIVELFRCVMEILLYGELLLTLQQECTRARDSQLEEKTR
jgi:CLIP-associating protein 1/2